MSDIAPTQELVPIFDGHNDTLLKLLMRKDSSRARSFFSEVSYDHIDLPRARRGGFFGGLFALFVPSTAGQDFSKALDPDDPKNWAPVDQSVALDYTIRMMAEAFRIEAESEGQVHISRSVKEIRDCLKDGRFTMMLHIEGAEAIDSDLASLEVLHAAGLRSIGPVWSRKNIFADGVPMAYPSSPDTGDGLTDLGKELVKRCNALGIMIDLAHINEKGFWDVAEVSDKPLIATHSNAHAICASARNLTDKQLTAIRERDGLVGINFHVPFLREDGGQDENTPLEVIVRHADYLIEHLGEDRVALGSDFDGCLVPHELGNVAGLPKLISAFRKAGYGEELIAKIAHENWLAALERSGL